MRRLRGRVCGVGCWLKYCRHKRRLLILPDAADLAAADPVSVVRCWAAWGRWVAEFRQRFTAWRVNGWPAEEKDDLDYLTVEEFLGLVPVPWDKLCVKK